MSTSCGAFTGEGVPSYQRTGLTQAKRSNFCLSATFRDLIPPPTGVVRGPLIDTKPFLMASRVASGSHSPVLLNAFSPARTSLQWICFSPPYAFETAASTTFIITGLMSTPIPSPSMKCIVGLFGTFSMPFSRVILSPVIPLSLSEMHSLQE